MFTDTMRENLLDSAQRVAGRKNRILNLGADVAGWAIRLAKGNREVGESDLFYSGEQKNDIPSDGVEIYDTPKQAYEAVLKNKIQPYKNDNDEYEFPKIVYLQRVWITSDKEVA